jgi:hypothetical protein
MLSKDPNDRYKEFRTIISELKALYARACEVRRG